MDLKGKKIILASGSPRRKELLAGLDVEFTVDTKNNFEEVYDPQTPGREVPVLLSKGKSLGFHRDLEVDEILITSDTVVLVDGHTVLGKPHSREQAIEMLKMLSGKSHEVITAITLRTTDRCETLSDVAVVHFKELSEDEIEYYVDKCRPFDKAGAYGIQEWIGYIGIGKIEGSFFTIMGFPTHLAYKELLEFIG